MALTHWHTQWRMVDSACVHSLRFFSSFRFVSNVWLYDYNRNMRWVVLRIIHFIMWMAVCLCVVDVARYDEQMHIVQCTIAFVVQCSNMLLPNVEHLLFSQLFVALLQCTLSTAAQNNAKRKMLWHQSLLLDCKNVMVYCVICDSMLNKECGRAAALPSREFIQFKFKL